MQEPLTDAILEHLPYPAFIVEDLLVTRTNTAAAELQLSVGTNIRELICVGAQEYAVFQSGKLYLQLNLSGTVCSACVTNQQNAHLFCILSGYGSNELRAMAHIASYLGGPLQNAISGIEQLTRNLPDPKDPAIRESIGQINRSLYQIIRSTKNMTDISASPRRRADQFRYLDANALISEFVEKLQAKTLDRQRTFTFVGFKKPVFTMIDAYAFERAFYNLISNAVKFSPESGTIRIKLSTSGNRLYLTVENSCILPSVQATQIFERYLREPGLEEDRYGIGLGISVVRNVASAHHGTLLITRKEPNTFVCVMSIAIREKPFDTLNSPLKIGISEAGGMDISYIELSDILSNEQYETI